MVLPAMGTVREVLMENTNILVMRKNVYFAVLPVTEIVQEALMGSISMEAEQINVSFVEVPPRGFAPKVLTGNIKNRFIEIIIFPIVVYEIPKYLIVMLNFTALRTRCAAKYFIFRPIK